MIIVYGSVLTFYPMFILVS